MDAKILECVNDVIVDENCMWIISDAWNCLFKYDFIKEVLQCTVVFPEELQDGSLLFSKIVKLQDEIYFIPRTAKNIFFYDLLKQRFQNLNVQADFLHDDQNRDVIIQNEYIYCINRFPDTILKINSDTKEVKLFKANNDQYINEKIERKIYRDYNTNSACLYKGKIIWPNYNNILTIFDTQREEFSVHMLRELPQEKIERLQEEYEEKEMSDWLISVKNYNDILFLISYGGKVYSYDDKTNKVEEELFGNDIDKNAYEFVLPFFANAIQIKEDLYFIPQYRNKCMKYNYNTKKYEEVIDNYLENWNGYKREYTVCIALNEQKILLYSYHENCFYILDIENNSVAKKEIVIPYLDWLKNDSPFSQLIPDFEKKKMLGKEGYWLYQLCNMSENERILKSNVNIGERIYKELDKY